MSDYRPVVLVHGLLSSRVNSDGLMARLAPQIREWLPGVYVKEAELGTNRLDGVITQSLLATVVPNSLRSAQHRLAQASSLFVSLDDQVRELCDVLSRDSRLSRGFNLVAHSQGALVARGFVERCGTPPVHSFVSLAGPHAGQFGLPFYAPPERDSLRAAGLAVAAHLASRRFYSPALQPRLSFAQYWRDPFNASAYEGAAFLADLNNEGPGGPNPAYRRRIAALNSLVLVGFEHDEVVVPRESSVFGFYAPNSSEAIRPLRRSPLYTRDLLGLAELDARGALHEAWADCNHSGPPEIFLRNHVLPFLNNTLPPPPGDGAARRVRRILARGLDGILQARFDI